MPASRPAIPGPTGPALPHLWRSSRRRRGPARARSTGQRVGQALAGRAGRGPGPARTPGRTGVRGGPAHLERGRPSVGRGGPRGRLPRHGAPAADRLRAGRPPRRVRGHRRDRLRRPGRRGSGHQPPAVERLPQPAGGPGGLRGDRPLPLGRLVRRPRHRADGLHRGPPQGHRAAAAGRPGAPAAPRPARAGILRTGALAGQHRSTGPRPGSRPLHEAVFRGVLHSHHDVYGGLEPAAALAVLDRLALPADTKHLAGLRNAPAGGPSEVRAGPTRPAVRRGAGGP